MSEVVESLKAALADRYTVERELGRGGMAVVYLAEDLRHGRKVAIKVLRPELVSAVAAERFLQEIRITAGLAHPHILPLLDSGEADGFLFYVMPYVEGESLREKLKREGRLSTEEALRIAREIADALSYAHDRDLLHRDIKPENVLLAAGHAVVADFGIARAVSEAAGERLTDTGVSVGTPAYMSPEQASGERELSGASDVYSLGCVLYEMLAGQPPIVDSSVQRIVSRKLLGEFQPVGEVCRELPPRIDAAISRALATDPAERLSNAGELAEALGAAVPAEARPRARRHWPFWAAAAGVAIVAGLAGYIVWGGGGTVPVATGATAIDPTNRIAVLPFSYRGSEEHAYLGEGMVDLLSYSLDGVGEARTVTPQTVFGVLRQYDREGSDPVHSATIAERLSAARFVEGEIVESGGHLRISARLVQVDADPGDATTAMVDGAIEDGIGGLVDALSAQLLAGSEAGQLSELGRVAGMTTDSLAALKAFLYGVRSLRAHEIFQARQALRRAVEIDSTFALAYWQLAEANLWGGVSPELTLEAAGRAVRWSEGLPWRERQTILAFDAFIRGDFYAAERRYRAVTNRYPDDVSAWLGLSFLYDMADLHGRPKTEIGMFPRQAYLWSVEYEPDWYDPPMFYWYWAVRRGDRALADSLVRSSLSRWWTSREEQPFYLRVLEAFCIGDQAAQDSIVAITISSENSVRGVLGVQYPSLCEAGVWRGAEVARALAGWAESERVRAWAHLQAAAYELALGHRGAARAEFEALRSIEPTWASQYETYWLLPATFGAQRDKLEAARDFLAAREVPMVPPLAAPENSLLYWCTTVNDSIHPHIQLYLLGRLSARLGDYDAALRYADEVEGLKTSVFHPSVSQDKAHAIRAYVLTEQGRYEEALAALEAAPRTVGNWAFVFSPFTREPQERYLRAELLAELGRHDEALRWLSSIGYESSETPMRAPAHLLSAQIHERAGAADSAAVHYRLFIDLWRDADPELQPQVEAAERALARLTGESGRSESSRDSRGG